MEAIVSPEEMLTSLESLTGQSAVELSTVGMSTAVDFISPDNISPPSEVSLVSEEVDLVSEEDYIPPDFEPPAEGSGEGILVGEEDFVPPDFEPPDD